MATRFERAVLADINPQLVNVYRCVKEQVDEVVELLKWHQQHHGQEYYYNLRRQHHLNTPVERAARLIYLNKTCYNGLYRENSQGQFNVPMGKYKNPAICDPALLKTASAILQRADIAELPFEMILDWPCLVKTLSTLTRPITPSVSPAALPATTAMALRPATRSVWPMCFGNWLSGEFRSCSPIQTVTWCESCIPGFPSTPSRPPGQSIRKQVGGAKFRSC